ncbi:hypothetical protein HDU98_008282 [Podochytrium sp. JEL0797]|nr:hypothetical protein HDU98_008282 [Podochytrium sp. JEL0797]
MDTRRRGGPEAGRGRARCHLVDHEYKILNVLELKQVEYLSEMPFKKKLTDHIDSTLEKTLPHLFTERALACVRRASGDPPTTNSTSPTPPWVLTSWEIELGDPISHGGFGEVLHATWLGHTLVAVKRLHIRLETQRLRDDFLKEVKVFPLRHPHVLPLLGACATAERPFMVAPYMAGGTALQYLERVRVERREREGCNVLFGVALRMQYLHARGVTHRDLKAVNVLIDNHGTAHVSDFGFATLRQFSTTRLTHLVSFGGTLRWMSPERLQGAKLSPP